MTFGSLIYSHLVSISDMAEWCHISRQTIYKYIYGEVDPTRISYINICHMASYLDVSGDKVYNAICESFEDVHVWSEDLEKWVKE